MKATRCQRILACVFILIVCQARAFATVVICWDSSSGRKCKEFNLSDCSRVIIPPGSTAACYDALIAAPEGVLVHPNPFINGSVILGTLGNAMVLATPHNTNIVLRSVGGNPNNLEFADLPTALDFEALGPVATGITLPGGSVEYPDFPPFLGQGGQMCSPLSRVPASNAGGDFCMDFTLLDDTTLEVVQMRLVPIRMSDLSFQPLAAAAVPAMSPGFVAACAFIALVFGALLIRQKRSRYGTPLGSRI